MRLIKTGFGGFIKHPVPKYQYINSLYIRLISSKTPTYAQRINKLFRL